MVEIAEDTDLAELCDAGDEHKLQTGIRFFQDAEEGFEDRFIMLLPGGILHGLQEGFVIFVHKHDALPAGLGSCTHQQLFKALPDGGRVIVRAVDGFPITKQGRKNILQRGLVIVPAVEVKIKDGIGLPGIRVVRFQLFNSQPVEKLTLSLPVGFHRGKEKALAESARATEKILFAGMDKVVDIFCFIHIEKAVCYQAFKALNADR